MLDARNSKLEKHGIIVKSSEKEKFCELQAS